MSELDDAAAAFRDARDRNEELQGRRRALEEAAAMAEREWQKLNSCGGTSMRAIAKDRMFKAKAEVRLIIAEGRTALKALNHARHKFERLNGTS
jgi:hypothetical protein